MVGLKVLIVEDEADFLALGRSWLEDEGYEVYAAANGWEGLQLFAEIRPQLTITDVRMPAMDGFQLISRTWANTGLDWRTWKVPRTGLRRR
jgi:two-component system response regulator TrcR